MANNPYVNKVDKADGTTIMDITDTTATESDVLSGKVFYKASGARSTGSVDLSEKADKVSGATSGNFAGLDSNGNLTDSGSKASDFLTSHQDISGKADKVTGATNGNFAALDSNGNLTDSGHKHSDYLTSHQDISGKADKADTVLTTTLSLNRKASTTVGTNSVAIGNTVEASGDYSYGEGRNTTASGDYSHAEGYGTIAGGMATHAQGYSTRSYGDDCSVSGKFNVQDVPDWVSGTSYAYGDPVVRNGITYKCKTANSDSTFTLSNWFISGIDTYAEIVGNGSGSNARSNARVLDWDGNERLKGDLYVGCGTDSSGGTKVATWSSIYPVGSVYMCANSNNPATLFGGTWVEFGIQLTWNDVENGTRSYTDGTGTGTLHFWRRTA